MFSANKMWKDELREKQKAMEERAIEFNVHYKDLPSKRKLVKDCTSASKKMRLQGMEKS